MTQQAKIIFPIFLVFVLVIVLPIGAVVTAEYYPEPQIAFTVAPPPFTSDTVLGAKLGTVIMHSTTGEIYTPSFVDVQSVPTPVIVTGNMKSYALQKDYYPNQTQNFRIFSIAYPYGLGSTPVITPFSFSSGIIPIIHNGPVTVYQTNFYIELFLLNIDDQTPGVNHTVIWRPASFFEPGTPYSLPSNFDPKFRVGSATNSTTNLGTYTGGGTIDNLVLGQFVEGIGPGGLSGSFDNPMIGPGAYTDPNNPNSPGVIYGDPPELPKDPDFVFSLINESYAFALEDAIGNKVKVNTAQMVVENGESGVTYKQNITFTDSGIEPSFQLKHKDNVNITINYNLYFGSSNVPVTYGSPIEWGGLGSGPPNVKDIYIGGIVQNDVNQKLGGQYTDTIYVNITAADN